jgi:polyisoprenoid-binding protein YceI
MSGRFRGQILNTFGWMGLAGTLLVTPAFAQTTGWSIDSAHSTARLFVASSARRDARVNVGVARLTGEVTQSSGDAPPSAFRFEIYPADKQPQAVQPGSPSYNPNAWNNTEITFQSSSVESLDQNTVRATGEMKVTYVSRTAYYWDAKFYSGPIWGPPVLHTAKREVTFEFQRVTHASGEWIGTSMIANNAFSVLWNAVVTTLWPPFVTGGRTVGSTRLTEFRCWLPASTTGEDFSGEACSGRTVDRIPRTDVRCWLPANSTGEDFSGEVCSGTPLAALAKDDDAVAAGAGIKARSKEMVDEVEIELDLHVTPRA